MTTNIDTDIESQSAEQIEAYLRQHPTFFIEREQLLSELYFPHSNGSVVSLVERQVNLLRERNIESRKRLNQFVSQAKTNDELFKKTQALVLTLLDATSLNELIKGFNQCALSQFDIDAVQVSLLNDKFSQANQLQKVGRETLAERLPWVLAIKNSISGHFREEELTLLFPREKGIKSAIVLPINHEGGLQAILSFGSYDSRYFDAKMDTLFVEFIASVLSRQLTKYQD